MSFSKRVSLRWLALQAMLWMSLMAVAGAAPAPRPPDVPGDHWAAPAVLALLRPETNLVELFGDGSFQGGETLRRYDFVKNLDNLVRHLGRHGVRLGPGGPLPDCPYTDVPEGHYSRDAIRRLLWMIPGSKNHFGGRQPMTRLDMAVWLHALLKDVPKAASVKPAPRPTDVDAHLAPMVCWALAAGEEGLISAYPDGRFHPDRALTRYEMAYTMYQVLRWLTTAAPSPVEVVQQPGTQRDRAAPELRVFEPEVEGARDFVVVVRKKQLRVSGIAADDTGIQQVTVNDHEAKLEFGDEADLVKADLKGPVAMWFHAQIPFPEANADGKSKLVIQVTDKAKKRVTKTYTIGSPKPDAPQVVHASTQPEGTTRVGRKWALLVGVNRYDDVENIPTLRYSVGDVTAVYKVLVDPQRGGFGKDTVYLLTDDTPDKPTNINIIKYLNRIARRAEPEDMVLVYFSGHGYEEAGRGYILPCNTDVEALAASAVDNTVLIDTLDRMKAQRIVTIIDACHSGAMRRTGGGAPALSGQYYSAYGSGKGRVVLASASAGQKAWEDARLKHGVFTEYVKQGFYGEADRNRDGAVTFMELAKYVYDNVKKWAEANNKEQEPMIQAENFAASDIILALNPEALPTGPLAEKKRKVYAALEPEDADYACLLLEKSVPTDQEKRILKYLDEMIAGRITAQRYLDFVRMMNPGGR
ncbi:MAG TPA: caspase family protein [Armatimonadota bacterium]|nr:caspase family protein [Armatimonadota bacterium]HOM80957.1 caspase family protein [Armatimonadota bacterium]HPO73021.1 caspase family protein [Armatimonadota bacterium]HPT98042.1 caspase family protein [Armatimonadota bacterium]